MFRVCCPKVRRWQMYQFHALSTEKPLQSQVIIVSPTINIALVKLVMTVAPQKLITN